MRQANVYVEDDSEDSEDDVDEERRSDENEHFFQRPLGRGGPIVTRFNG